MTNAARGVVDGGKPAAVAAAGLAPGERRERIAEFVLGRESTSARELAARFDVSLMTVHRDLDELERQGVLRKFRGGATPQPSSLFESNVRYRLSAARAEKEALARYALGLVEPGQAVLLDDATTTLALARLLPEIAPVTVITNYLATIQALHEAPEVRLIALGGEYLPSHDSFTGVVCEAAIASLRADVFFMSTSAVSGGVAYHQEQEIVKVKRAMLGAATRRVLLLDHGKLGKAALHRLAPLTDFDLVVVDAGADEARLRDLRETKVPVEVAPL
ncbi:MAG: DeoR/GlpR family DNA-binding transcription regulator [Chloroflexota bacterium]|nr:DeoR/GlpR family DNA-binding transcription regulator [Chloroflexota bacterium]